MDAPLTIIDGIVIVLTILSAILAMAQGLTREFLWIASIVAAAIISVHFAVPMGPVFTDIVDISPLSSALKMEQESLGSLLAGSVMFIILWIIFSILTQKLSEWVDHSAISSVDRFLGLMFGLVRGLFIVGSVYILYTYFVDRKDYSESLRHSKTLPVLDYTAGVMASFSYYVFPESFAESIDNHLTLHSKGISEKKQTPLKEKSDAVQKIINQHVITPSSPSTSASPNGISAEKLQEMNSEELEIILDAVQTVTKGVENDIKNDAQELTRP